MLTSVSARYNLNVLIVALILTFLPRGELSIMLQDPQLADPTPPVPQQNTTRPSERGIAQTVVTSLLVVLAFGAGWFGNAYVNHSKYNKAEEVKQNIINQAYTEITKNYDFTEAIDKQK